MADAEKDALEKKEEAKRAAAASSLCVANGIFMTAVMMILPARAPMVLQICNGDAQEAARTLGFMSSCGAALEVFLNPVLGRLSDLYGRKPFLLMAPAVRASLHALAASFPDSIKMQYVDRIITAAMVFTFQAPINAALADIYTGPDYAVAMSRNQTFFGLGCALGPFIGSRLGGAKAFFGSAAMFVASMLYLMVGFTETLTDEHRKPFEIAACNPLRFVKLFTHGPKIAAMAGTIALQSFGDYPNIYDFNFLYLKSVFGYGQQQVGQFATAVGVSQILGGEATGAVIKKVGQTRATLIGNLSWVFALGALGTSRSVPQLAAALVAMTFGHLRSTPVAAFLQKDGQETGMGRAEIISAQMNLTALIKVIAPILYGNVFAWATSKGRKAPGAPYLLICLLTILAQLLFSSEEEGVSTGRSARRISIARIWAQSGN